MSEAITTTTIDIAPKDTSKRTSYIIIGITAGLALIFLGIVIYSAVSRTLLFPEFVPDQSGKFTYPLGRVVELTPEEVAKRQAIVNGTTGS